MKRKAEIILTACLLLLAGLAVAIGCQPTAAECPDGFCGTTCPTGVRAPEAGKVQDPVPQPAEITTPVLERLLSSGVKLTLLDARTGKYDDGLRIPGARSLSPEAEEEVVKGTVSSKDDLIVTYCSNLKCQASHKLARHLAELGYRNVLIYSEGIAGWKEAGKDVVKVN